MRRFLKLYTVEQKLAFRSIDSIIFGVIMPIGILFLISIIAGGKMAGDSGYTYLDSAFASLIAVGIVPVPLWDFHLRLQTIGIRRF